MTYKKYWRYTRLKTLTTSIIQVPLCAISRFLPKFKYEIFGSMNGYKVCDNSKFLFENISDKDKYFITKNSDFVAKDQQIIYAYSPFGIYLQMFAKKAYWTHGINDFIAPLIIGSYIIGLQHGLPGKVGPSKIKGLMSETKFTVKRWLAPYLINYYCHEVWSPDPKYDSSMNCVFEPLRPKITRKQIPRIEFQNKAATRGRILFAPSHRDQGNIVQTLMKSGITSTDFTRLLSEDGLDFYFRPHPLTLDAIKTVGCDLPSEISLDTSDDVHDSLTSYSLVITDISGLIIDCWELGIETACICHDLDDLYLENTIFEWFYTELKARRFENLYDALKHYSRGIDGFQPNTVSA